MMKERTAFEGEQKIGALSKVWLFVVVEDGGKKLLPVKYTEATDSLNLLSTSAIIEDRNSPDDAYQEFEDNPQVGLDQIKERYLQEGVLDELEEEPIVDHHIDGYLEQKGPVAGLKQDLHYQGYVVEQPLKPQDFKEGVLFIFLDELKAKVREAREKGEDLNEIQINVGGKDYRINYGIISGLEAFDKL